MVRGNDELVELDFRNSVRSLQSVDDDHTSLRVAARETNQTKFRHERIIRASLDHRLVNGSHVTCTNPPLRAEAPFCPQPHTRVLYFCRLVTNHSRNREWNFRFLP